MTVYENIMLFYSLSCFQQHEALGKYHNILKYQLYLLKCACMLHLFILLAVADVKIQ